MLSLYHTSLKCQSRKTGENMKYVYRYCSHLPGPEFMYPSENVEILPSQTRGELNSEIAYFLENYTGTDE
jgi:hypothetical protein